MFAEVSNEGIRCCNELYTYYKTLKSQRCIIPEYTADIHLDGHWDTSEITYTAVLNLHCVCSGGNNHIQLLAAKTKHHVPIKQEVLPTLELCMLMLH